MLSELLNEKSAEELGALGKVSNAIKAPGAHKVKITEFYETNADAWNSMTIVFTTKDGETQKHSEFFSTPKTESEEDVNKAKAANDILLGKLNNIVKAAGFPDLKSAVAGATAGVDSKNRPTKVYPKPVNKELYITTFTEIDGDNRDANKVFVKQTMDPYKCLSKSGQDGMKRDCLESYSTEAKGKFEVAYKFKDSIVHQQKLAELKEIASSGTIPAPQPQTQAEPVTPTAPPVIATEDDI